MSRIDNTSTLVLLIYKKNVEPATNNHHDLEAVVEAVVHA